MIHLLHLFAATGDPSEIGKAACGVASGAVGCGSTGLLAPDGFVFSAIKTVLIVAGAISVLMVIIGGLRYTLSGGDSAGIKSAKDTIIYALIGLAISLLAFFIVSFIVNKIG